MDYFAAIVPLAAAVMAAPQADYKEQFELIAKSVASAQSCEQLGFAVDRQGIVDWSLAARAGAVAAGASESLAAVELEESIREEIARAFKRHAQARRMQHAPDAVIRNNRALRLTCLELAKDPLSAPYIARGQG